MNIHPPDTILTQEIVSHDSLDDSKHLAFYFDGDSYPIYIFKPPNQVHVHKKRWIKEAAEQLTIPHKEKLLAVVDLYIVPYLCLKRFNAMTQGNQIVLYGGRAPFNTSRTATHFLIAHELGHVFDNVMGEYQDLMFYPENETSFWVRYAKLRGFRKTNYYEGGNKWTYNSNISSKANNTYCTPIEVFAEDFRYLFGSPLAREADWDEQTGFEPPDDNIRNFMLEVAELWGKSSPSG